MVENARHLATWEDLLATPNDGITYEIIQGVIESVPRPLPSHGLAQFLLASELGLPFHRGRGGPGGWWPIIEPEVRLARHEIVVPDVAGWRRKRMPEFPETRPIDIVPDWVCEVLSPSNRKRDRVVKADIYLRSGVSFFWIIDVEERTLEAFNSQEKKWVLLGAWTDGDRPRVPPFEAIELDVEGLFPPMKKS